MEFGTTCDMQYFIALDNVTLSVALLHHVGCISLAFEANL